MLHTTFLDGRSWTRQEVITGGSVQLERPNKKRPAFASPW